MSSYHGLISKTLHNLCNLGMTKSEIIVLVIPFTNIESFVIHGKY